MKIILTCMLFFILTGFVHAQMHSVVASDGDVFSSEQGSLSWTLGEIAIETYQQGFGYLTQGFNQTFARDALADVILVYPNPTFDFAFIKTTPEDRYSLELYTLQMEKLMDGVKLESGHDAVYQIDLQNLGTSVYLLVMLNHDTGKKSIVKILKL